MKAGLRSSGFHLTGGAAPGVVALLALLLHGCGDKEEPPAQQAVSSPPPHVQPAPQQMLTYAPPSHVPEQPPRYRPEAAPQQVPVTPHSVPQYDFDDGGNPWAGRGFPEHRGNGYRRSGSGQRYGGYRYRPLDEEQARRSTQEQPLSENPNVPPPYPPAWPGGAYAPPGYGAMPYWGAPYWGAPFWGGGFPYGGPAWTSPGFW